jgi:predicted NUDIX family NTP pyrophosphohydrolase
MAKTSAGILIYRRSGSSLEVLLVHPGGPFWRTKDDGAWTIPKGELETSEDPLQAARRELQEETGLVPEGPFVELKPVRQRSGKLVQAFATELDCDPTRIQSNTFEIEWPPRSGRRASFPEVDRASYFGLDVARRKINAAQAALLDELEARLASGA